MLESYLSAASIIVNGVDIFDTPSEDNTPRLSRDANLTALVQLGALRLDTDRSFLSLIDGRYQYIIAEATRTHSVARDGVYEKEGDQLYLGLKKLDITWGVCPNTMEVFTDETGSRVIQTENIYADRTRYIIRDFIADAHYRECPYIKGFPYMRSYAEVPLISPLGYIIGSYCVVDNRVRTFDDSTIDVLAEVADRIIAHLELIRTKQSRVRSEQLIRGLTAFMERESSYPREDDSESTKTTEPPASIHEKALSISTTAEDSRPPNETRPSDSSIDTQPSATSSNLVASPSNYTPLSTPIPGLEENPFEQQELTPEDAAVKEPVLSLAVQMALARAATLIREGMDADGAAFLDAVPHGFASRSSQPTPDDQVGPFPTDNGGESEAALAEDEDSAKCTSLARSMRYQPDPVVMAAGKSPVEPGVSHSPLAETVLQRLIRRYPRGHIFSADEHGPIDERYCPGKKFNSAKAKHHRRRSSVDRFDMSELFRLRPEARYMIFLPLWHFQRECWFLATFAWTNNPAQSFGNDDLTYLSAFGNSVMAEIARFETLAISRAKSDFISSVSHELRSPLHGILASAELLREAPGNSSHNNMIDMIESCGNTLLDTMNHLLDFAKINNLARNVPKAKASSNSPPEHGELSVSSSVDVSNLVQEVVESVYLGHVSKYSVASTVPMDSDVFRQDHSVLVTMNIEPRKDWTFNIQVGAWKRIVMNLFGNALKYTRAGRITISLRIVNELDESGTYTPHVLFEVRDTGIGMSPDYLKYHLFTPFAQENTLSPGTGLGLSIVKQVVSSLGGKLDVESRLGVGTRVAVFIPATPESFDQCSQRRDISTPDEGLRGKSICFVPPEEYSSASTEYKVQRLCAARTAIESIAIKSLGMEIIPFAKDGAPDDAPDFCFVDASILDDSAAMISTLPQWALLRRSKTRIVLLSYGLHDGRGLDVPAIRLRQPIGPRKLIAELKDAEPTVFEPSRTMDEAVPILPLMKPQLTLPREEASGAVTATKLDLAEALHDSINTSALSKTTTPEHQQSVSAEQTKPKHHVLIVDDNPINLKLLSTQLQRLGHTYGTAMNGLEAIQLFKASIVPFDFVFMDISMPIMNGFEATQEIRSWEKARVSDQKEVVKEGAGTTAAVPATTLTAATIVALTGLGSNLSRQEAFSSGVNVFLTKPVSLKEVGRILEDR